MLFEHHLLLLLVLLLGGHDGRRTHEHKREAAEGRDPEGASEDQCEGGRRRRRFLGLMAETQ